MNDEKKDKIPLGVRLLFLVGVGLMGAGSWITSGLLGWPLIFVGFGLAAFVVLGTVGMALKKKKDEESKPC